MSHLKVDYKINILGLVKKEDYLLMLKEKYLFLTLDSNKSSSLRLLKRINHSANFLAEVKNSKRAFVSKTDTNELASLEAVVNEIYLLVDSTLFSLDNLISSFIMETELSGKFPLAMLQQLEGVMNEAKKSLIETIEASLDDEQLETFKEFLPSFEAYYETMQKVINWKFSRLLGSAEPSIKNLHLEEGSLEQANVLTKAAPEHMKPLLSVIEDSLHLRVPRNRDLDSSLHRSRISKTTTFKLSLENEKITALDFAVVMKIFEQHLSSDLFEHSSKEVVLANMLSFINEKVFMAVNLNIDFLITKFGYKGHSEENEDKFLDHYQKALQKKVEEKLEKLKWQDKNIKITKERLVG